MTIAHTHDDVSTADWDACAEACPHATFFHTRAWAEVCAEAFEGCTPAARLYEFTDGTRALVPGVTLPAARGLFTVFKSTHPSDYGGPLSAEPLPEHHVAAIADDLRGAGFGQVIVYGNPFERTHALPGFRCIEEFTQAVPLDGGSVMGVFGSYERRDLRRAERKGVRVLTGSTDGAVEALYGQYMLSAKRWGARTTWLRPIELCRAAVRQGGDSVQLRLAMLGDEVIGGAVDYFHGPVAIAGWRAFDYEYRNFFPNLVLVREALQEAAARGCRSYDMGPSGGLAGVEEFKQRCGAVRIGFRTWLWEHPAYKAYSAGRRGFSRAAGAVRTHPGS